MPENSYTFLKWVFCYADQCGLKAYVVKKLLHWQSIKNE